MKRFHFTSISLATLIVGSMMTIPPGCKKDDKTPPPTLPVVITTALTNITATGATGGGSIVSDGGAAIINSGIVWSKTNVTPTLADSVVAGTVATGTFTSEISGLDDNTSYYIRAFATNSVGTGYGEVVTLNTINDTNKVRFTYNGEEVVYGVIVSPTTGRRWLDRNLGAKQVADSAGDYNAYGDLFQWGRPDDGHQLIHWTSSTSGTPVNGTTTTSATSDVPDHNKFIADPYVADPWYGDWRDDNNRNRWATSPQGPCPEGWHVPTLAEWRAEVANTQSGGAAPSGGMIDRNTAYSMLKLTVAGLREAEGGSFVTSGSFGPYSGNVGVYWISSDAQVYTDPSVGGTLKFSNTGLLGGSNGVTVDAFGGFKAQGRSVRCIKD